MSNQKTQSAIWAIIPAVVLFILQIFIIAQTNIRVGGLFWLFVLLLVIYSTSFLILKILARKLSTTGKLTCIISGAIFISITTVTTLLLAGTLIGYDMLGGYLTLQLVLSEAPMIISSWDQLPYSITSKYAALILIIAITLLGIYVYSKAWRSLQQNTSFYFNKSLLSASGVILFLFIAAIIIAPKRVYSVLGRNDEPLSITLGFVIWKNRVVEESNIEAVNDRQILTESTEQGTKKDVILVAIECLRADHLSAYGYNRVTMPTLENYVQESNAWQAAICSSVCASTYCAVNGILSSRYRLGANRLNLQEVLAKAGYESNFFLSGNFKEFQGFESISVNGIDRYSEGIRVAEVKNVHPNDDIAVIIEELDVIPPLDSSNPQFIYAHFARSHRTSPIPEEYLKFTTGTSDYYPPSTNSNSANLSIEDQQYFNNWYDDGLFYVDDALKQFLAHPKIASRLDNAIVVVTGDHGQQLWEHGQLWHGHSTYPPEVVVPLFISGIEMLAESKNITSHSDIAPTILKALNLSVPKNYEGVSLQSAQVGEREFVFTKAADYFSAFAKTKDQFYEIVINEDTGNIKYLQFESDLQYRELKTLSPTQQKNTDSALVAINRRYGTKFQR